eukprot:15116428-Heterocapsa_arctica.AAC.1
MPASAASPAAGCRWAGKEARALGSIRLPAASVLGTGPARARRARQRPAARCLEDRNEPLEEAAGCFRPVRARHLAGGRVAAPCTRTPLARAVEHSPA